jgi:hypothetical protein
MTTIYLVWHFDQETPEDDVQEKLIGVYSTEERAKAAIDRLRDKPGFRDFPNRWAIHDRKLNFINWDGGYETVKYWEAE